MTEKKEKSIEIGKYDEMCAAIIEKREERLYNEWYEDFWQSQILGIPL